jgi:hypothetical protein
MNIYNQEHACLNVPYDALLFIVESYDEVYDIVIESKNPILVKDNFERDKFRQREFTISLVDDGLLLETYGDRPQIQFSEVIKPNTYKSVGSRPDLIEMLIERRDDQRRPAGVFHDNR